MMTAAQTGSQRGNLDSLHASALSSAANSPGSE